MKSLYARRQREVETNSSLSCWKEEDKRLRGIQKGIWEVNYSKTCSTSRGICMSATLCKYNNQSFVFSPNQIQTQITGAEIRVTQNIEDDNYTTREREKSFFFFFTKQFIQLDQRMRGGSRERQREDPTENPMACNLHLSCTFLGFLWYYFFAFPPLRNMIKKRKTHYIISTSLCHFKWLSGTHKHNQTWQLGGGNRSGRSTGTYDLTCLT